MSNKLPKYSRLIAHCSLLIAMTAITPAFANEKGLEERVADLERRLDNSPLTKGDRRLSLSGYMRFRGISQYNFDLNDDKSDDNYIDFVDVRSYLTLEVKKNNIKGVVSVDIAGDNFNDGVILGYDDPAKNRPVTVNLQYLYLDYSDSFLFSVGRMPAKVGHGIVANITRDMLKIGKGFDNFQVMGVWVKGGEGITQNGSVPTQSMGTSNSRRILNDSDGSDHDLDLYGVVITPLMENGVQSPLIKGVRGLSFYAMQKFDTSMDKVYPEKIFVGLSSDGRLNNFSYAGEITYMGGNTPAGQQGASPTERARQNGYMIYADGTYDFDSPLIKGDRGLSFSAGLSFGMGSGDNNPNDKMQENFQNLFMDEVGFHYTYIYSDDIHGYDSKSSDVARGSGFANTTWLQIHGSINPIEDLTIEGSYTYLYASKEQLEGTGPLGDGAAVSDSKTREIGQELDLKAYYSINDNTAIKLFGGMFFPGNIYGRNADSALKGEVGIEYKF